MIIVICNDSIMITMIMIKEIIMIIYNRDVTAKYQ